MPAPFQLKSTPAIHFASGALKQLPQLLSGFGRRILVTVGGNSLLSSPAGEELLQELKRAGFHIELAHIKSEPSPVIINDLTARYRNSDIEAVVAIGGGSVMDAGKALSAMLREGGDVTRFLEGIGTAKLRGDVLPLIAVPTTSGTGSEATANAVLSSVGENGFKKSLRHPACVPNLALIDPQLTLSCPPQLTAFSGMDCFTQLVEAYLSTAASPITDALALEGLHAVSRSLRLVVEDGGNLAARSDMALATLLSGIVLTNAGLGTVHGFASSVGGRFVIPHGLVCGALMAPINARTLAALRESPQQADHAVALAKYATLGRIFHNGNVTDDAAQDAFIALLQQLSEEFTLPGFARYGMKEDDTAAIAAASGNKNNPVQFDDEELQQLLIRCL